MVEENLQPMDDFVGFNPSELAIYNQQDVINKNEGSIFYKAMPKDSKSEDGCYRALIKVIYNPYDIRHSILERISYGLEDKDGFFQVVSKLTNNDVSCPIFKAWKTCRYSSDPSMQIQMLPKEQGGRQLFDRRFERFVLIQVIEDKNRPELENKYLFWKLPKSILDKITSKMNPAKETGKAAIPVMDALFGRAIELTVIPGPDDPAHPERKQREISYANSEISDDIVTCVNPDGTSLLTDEEQEVLNAYIVAMEKIWRTKKPEVRAEMEASVNADPNTTKLREIYRNVLNRMKEFCPNLIEELGYKDWTAEETNRVTNWINIVLSGNDPRAVIPTMKVKTPTVEASDQSSSDISDDLPF